ncbi:MAG TPA: Ig-like domain-containing protein [Pseudonocardia sp.]
MVESGAAGGRRRTRVLVVVLCGLVAVAGLVAALLVGVIGPATAEVALQPVSDATPTGAAPVNPADPVSATATRGELREVTLTPAGGSAVAGTLSEDHTRWTPSVPLAYGKTYTWGGTAADARGRTVPLKGSFRTVKPASVTGAKLNIADGGVVGIAAPIVVQFDGHVANREVAERALSVQTSNQTEGSWGWLQDDLGGSRVFWRPKEYWKPDTAVTVKADVFGVDLGKGNFGEKNVGAQFTVGRAQIVKADVGSHQLVVQRDGVEVARYEASYGKESDPDRNTHNGIHVVTEKFTDKRMVNPQYHYDVMEHFAVRISNNGEFIHANPDTEGVQGEANVSHGCVNLSTADAKAYFDSVLYGDPVEVTGSPVPLSARDGDIWVWTMDWPAWQRLSALHRDS